MISPYVRRYRLAQELRRLREAAGLNHLELARNIGVDRSKISRLENGRVSPDINDVMKLLEALGVEGAEWTSILKIAQDAATRGWWESGARVMGERQALYADLEAGAVRIREYQPSSVPGLLQTAEYARARLLVAGVMPAGEATVEGVLEGRAGRQRMLRRPGAPSYELLIDEAAVRRPSAPPPVMREQLLHLAARAAEENVTVLVLPIEAVVRDYQTLPGALSLYTYPDPGDPVVAAIESITTDVIVTDSVQVARYAERYDLLAEVALSADDSAEFISQAATKLPDR
jgi:transcriptional regulator with XRE-family HTH domain